MIHRRTVAEIDLDALESNVRNILAHFPKDVFFCPMVKANAYGHGEAEIALALERIGVRHLGVCPIEEGLALRAAGVKTDILVFSPFDREGAAAILRAGLTPVVGSLRELEHLEELASAPVNVHLKFDTGMHRVGFATEEAAALRSRFEGSSKLRLSGVCSHLLRGEDADRLDGESARQLLDFQKVVRMFSSFHPVVHALNSAAVLQKIAAGPTPSHPLHVEPWGLRPGILIYGVSPLERSALELAPVMTLKSEAILHKQVPAGKSVSYNATWRATRDSIIAIVPIGYADGYHRLLSNKASALYEGKKVPVVGNVCMDYLMLDVTEHATASRGPGAEVVLFGRSQFGTTLSAAELAVHASTIPWEIFTSVGVRVPRVYRGGAW